MGRRDDAPDKEEGRSCGWGTQAPRAGQGAGTQVWARTVMHACEVHSRSLGSNKPHGGFGFSS